MRAPVVVLAALAAACGAPPPPRPPLQLAPFTVLRAGNFPGAPAVLAGFAPADDDVRMRVGDAALLGLELHRDGRIERQLLLLEVTDLKWRPPDSATIGGVLQPDGGGVRVRTRQSFTVTSTKQRERNGEPDGEPEVEERTHGVTPIDVRLTRFDAAGRSLRASVVTLFEEPLATGWWPYAMPGGDVAAEDYALALTMSLQELAGRDPVLQELLFRVVDEPSLWSVATHLGVKVVLRWAETKATSAPVVVEGFAGEVRTTTLDLVVNGDVASWVTMLVTQPNGATRACGGLVGAIAQHPGDPGRLAVVRLLATRRGAP